MTKPEGTTRVNCPTCKTPVIWSTESPFRPFCSERCKLIDLGEWANEGYQIPVSEDDSDPNDFSSSDEMLKPPIH